LRIVLIEPSGPDLSPRGAVGFVDTRVETGR
jgi:hypothetical protein